MSVYQQNQIKLSNKYACKYLKLGNLIKCNESRNAKYNNLFKKLYKLYLIDFMVNGQSHQNNLKLYNKIKLKFKQHGVLLNTMIIQTSNKPYRSWSRSSQGVLVIHDNCGNIINKIKCNIFYRQNGQPMRDEIANALIKLLDKHFRNTITSDEYKLIESVIPKLTPKHETFYNAVLIK